MEVWMANKAKFTPPSCYQYTVTTKTISSSSAISRVVNVKDGVALGGDMSLADYMDEISTSCYRSCPMSGALCSITYYVTGYPYEILIDDNQSLVGEEMNVVISSYSEVECDAIDEAMTAPPSDATSDVPSDVVSNVPSDVPTMVGQPIDAPAASPSSPLVPVTGPVDMPVASPVAENGDVSDINGINVESSSALGL